VQLLDEAWDQSRRRSVLVLEYIESVSPYQLAIQGSQAHLRSAFRQLLTVRTHHRLLFQSQGDQELIGLLQALGECERKLVVHHDIKPRNVLLTNDMVQKTLLGLQNHTTTN
jgi:serine/threonine protein kinase